MVDFQCKGSPPIPCRGAKISHALQPKKKKQKTKQKQCCNGSSIKTLKMAHILKNLKKKEYDLIFSKIGKYFTFI